jgi:hypothetical protein
MANEVFQTPYVRLAWPKLTDETAEDKANGKKKFSCSIYIPKNEEAYASLMTDGREESVKKLVPKLLKDAEGFVKTMRDLTKKVDPKSAAKIFKDGDKKADDKKAELELEKPEEPMPAWVDSTRNFWILNVSTEFKPKFFGPKAADGAQDDGWAEEELYAGAWVRLDVRSPYKWNYQGKKGASIGMGGKVQKWQDAEAFSSGTSVTAEDTDEVVPAVEDADTID